jgi:hypothetical protein
VGTAFAVRPYVMPACDCCNETITGALFMVEGNPERFCSLVCTRIFYARPTRWISQHRKERVQ